MNDEELRSLEREALIGDLEAAYALYRVQIRHQGGSVSFWLVNGL